MSEEASIIVADDHLILRDGLKAILSRDPKFKVVGEAGEGRDALRLVAERQPDLLILDLNMPRSNGLEILAEVKRSSPKTRVLVLTVHDTEEHVFGALKAGADGYVLKDAGAAELLLAVKEVLRGQKYLSGAVAKCFVDVHFGAKEPGSQSEAADALTVREREILKLVAEGYRNREIGEYLCISGKTVEKHRASLMRKLNLNSLSDLVAYVVKKGLFPR
jgi:DNA-binding NarL/FixJ family response regulator